MKPASGMNAGFCLDDRLERPDRWRLKNPLAFHGCVTLPFLSQFSAMKKILIVEDETLVAQSLAQIVLRQLKDVIDTCDVAHNANEALHLLEKNSYDLALLDVRLPDISGTELAGNLRANYPKTRILMLSALCSPFLCYQLTRLKIDGFAHKLESMENLEKAIRTVLNGEVSFCANFIDEHRRLNVDENAFTKLLGDRELEVLQHFVRGLRDTEIAETMNISVRTVETHRYNMIKKLGLADKAALRYYAKDMGIC
jgi:DNA-binding NarL/FixJ family response regulator